MNDDALGFADLRVDAAYLDKVNVALFINMLKHEANLIGMRRDQHTNGALTFDALTPIFAGRSCSRFR